jgi:hypothetical protein
VKYHTAAEHGLVDEFPANCANSDIDETSTPFAVRALIKSKSADSNSLAHVPADNVQSAAAKVNFIIGGRCRGEGSTRCSGLREKMQEDQVQRVFIYKQRIPSAMPVSTCPSASAAPIPWRAWSNTSDMANSFTFS